MDAAEVLPFLQREGWIELRSRTDLWRNTMQGNALAQAKARRVSRAVAQRHLDALLQRVRALKSDGHHLYRVYRVALFGSFTDPTAAEVGDVDVVIELATKEPNWERHLALEEMYREAESARGRRFPSFLDRLVAPQLDPFKFLKGRSAVISIHDAREYEGIPLSAFKVIYEDPIDEPGRTSPSVAGG
jgi:predicted nucleotidyltransferase